MNRGEGDRRSRATSAALLLALGAAFTAASWPTLSWWWQRCRDESGDFAHGPLVPLVSAAILFHRRRSLREAATAGTWAALPFLLAGLALLLAASAVRIDFLGGLGLLVVVPSLTALFAGSRVIRAGLLPFAYLVFAIPPPMFLLAEVTQRLKEWVLGASAAVLGVFVHGVEVQGSFLLLPGVDGRLLVDDECSGLHSLVSLVALGTLMAATAKRGLLGKLFLALASVPIALFANLLRVLLLCTVALHGGTAATARWHDLSGAMVYAVAIGCYVLLDRAGGKRRVAP